MIDIRVTVDRLHEGIHCTVTFLDAGAFGEVKLCNDLRTHRFGKELLFDEGEKAYGPQQAGEGAGDDRLAVGQAPIDDTAELIVKGVS